ncbi:T9SS type A sorting domain-containing protein, partial [candidate division KSB1 bacterium]|nr:T9SS type A sorting domain-containing protein [candidate division KSB1 bacterium]
DLSAENAVSLKYQFEQTGGGEEPDPGDDLVIEFRDAFNNWIELGRHPGSEGGLPVFTRKEIVLPPSAYHRDFRVRFRNLGAPGLDDWFVDDILLDVFAPSDIEVVPTALSVKLFEDDEATRGVTLNNLGVGDLFYRLRIVPPEFQNASGLAPKYPTSFYKTVLLKGENDWRRGRDATLGRGGPDNFGYTWRDSDDPSGPDFVWEDISATGARIPDLGDDENVGFYSVGFAFPFYDSVFTQFRVCSNGFISFTSDAVSFSNNPIPSVNSINDLIAPFWDDLDPRPGAVYYHSNGQRLVVQWQNVVRTGSSDPFTFQLILFANGNIRFQYLQMGASNNFATIGMQNHDGSDGVEIAFNTTYVKNNLAVQIERPASWLSYSPKVGMLTSGGTLDLAIHFSASGLQPDSSYRAELRIESNDLDEPSVAVQLTLEVLALGDSTGHFPPPETTAVKYPIVIAEALIDGEALASGDEIGVFTSSGKVAGALVWQRAQPGRVVVYGDDPATPDVEGFLPGEPMYFRIWDSSRNDRDYPATANYMRGDGRFGTADSAHISVLEATTTFARQKALQSNWSWISFNVQPASTDIEELLAETKQLRIMKDGAGHTFIPNLINTIQNLDPLAGYSVYLAAPDSIAISGEEVPPFTPIPLQAGWNFISYLPVHDILAPRALHSIYDQLVIAKNDLGGFFIPSVGNINTIGDMAPGEGYKVYMSAPDTLVYPLAELPSAQPKVVATTKISFGAMPQHFKAMQRGSDNYIVIVQAAKVQGASLRAGDEIGIFTKHGELVGAGVWPQSGALGIAAWRAEMNNEEARGFELGAPMRFKIWRQEDNLEVEMLGSFQRGDGAFGSEAFALVELHDSALPETFALEQNYPNPFARSNGAAGLATTIRYALPQPSHVTIRIYDVLGQLVRTLQDEPQIAGFHRVQWDGRNAAGREVAAGVYFYRMQAGKFEATRKLAIVR